MKPLRDSIEITTGLAIFSMLFGAGNIVAPLQVGVTTGSAIIPGILPFLMTALGLPLLGLVAMILFNGNYYAFFNRLGSVAGTVSLFICMLIIGPLVAMPRLVTTTYTLLEPVLPTIPLFLFTLFFVGATFVCTMQKNKIMDLLGTLISPLLLISLTIIIVKGIFAHPPLMPTRPVHYLWLYNLQNGYLTLDLLGSIFFASIMLGMLEQQTGSRTRTRIAIHASCIAIALLGLIYLGLAYLGAYYGPYISCTNMAELFSTIVFSLFDTWAALLVSSCIFLACFSTMVALATVSAEYLHQLIADKNSTYTQSLCIVLGISALISNVGLTTILSLSQPIIIIGYPPLIMLTLVNCLYKWWGIKTIKAPMAIATFGITFYYFLC